MAQITGTDNSDILTGGPDNDTILGLGGNDTLNGAGGNDTIDGGPGNDLIIGGPGTDTLTGGTGADTFQDTAADFNGDTITDFLPGDRIQITDLPLANANIQLVNSTITYGTGSTAGLINIGNGISAGRFVLRALGTAGTEIRFQQDAHNDFNGDGHSDILLRHDNGTISEWLGGSNGSLSWNSNASYGLDTSWHVAGSGDFNGDGRVDLLLRNDNGTVTEWLGQSNGGFVWNSSATYGVDPGWNVAGIGDFNGDGRADVLLRYTNGTVIDWLGQPNGTFFSNHANATYSLPAGWNVAGTGDFNGDGVDDILLRNDNGSITEWLGQPNGSFAWNSNATYGVDPGWTVAGTGDFNGDGRADVLLHYTNGTIIDWLGQADGTFFSNHANATYALPAGWNVAGIGDFNGDATDDVLLRNDNGTITEWLGQANGSFVWNSSASYGLDTSWHVQDHLL